ncbi:MAG: hypothetical protein COX31_03520 [Candidatus Moranbacteria bacterium CG23_combo_of_CG06-09_8_20_14_all_40_16]|nr:MAG: hypothetical protein COX31_03520 [Candidatus Moranbacteria bacterium CG23_combo_of_CG06-09_8_20_14_all_40_16]
MSNPWEKQSNTQQEKQERQVESITENEFKEKTNKILDDALVSNIKDEEFDLKNPKDKKWYDAMIDTKKC